MRFPITLLAGTIFFARPTSASTEIAAHSPFLPLTGTSPAATADASSFELRGIMSNSNETLYCIYDAQKKRCTWVALNERGQGYLLASADPVGGKVELIAADGRRLALALKEATTVQLHRKGEVSVPAQAPGPEAAVKLTAAEEDEIKSMPPGRAEAVRRYYLNLKLADLQQKGVNGGP